ncbi:TetR family transcriptional regulator [Rhodococcus sp. 14-2686-1-2]|nr:MULTISPECIES: TetR/AcrR family transcriptional regulator [unclassified Rhodococcus (in: high G+C Gram-positive bacteria)]OZE93178.1 TetR family transcriptional regulator [Rhodococcus sp. 15-1189-1-1a]OZF08296.1 TetR family transcriptional regulator [Rhodococcus sp. 14-2686-1-2]
MATRTKTSDVSDVRSAILTAAETCFERFGIAKTTMEDVARAADLSRATVYRYFADRESLIIESVARRARLNMVAARKFIARWPTIEEKLLEGICQNVERGVRDPMVHLLVSPSEMMLATSLLTTSGKAIELTSELWEPILTDAQEAGEIRSDIDIRLLCEWISELEIMCISQLNGGSGSLNRFREKIANFVIPALS